jgi:type I restriction enzyme S subunit
VPVHPGQVIMSICATVGRPIIVGMDACIHDGFVVFDQHQDRIYERFLVHHLRHMERFFLSKGQTGTQVNINTGIVNDSPICLPDIPEQRQIAAILDTLDDAIRKTEQIINKLKQVKQGLLHDLLTRGIDDNGDLRDPDRHPEQFKDSALGWIPKVWTTVGLGQLVDPARPIVYGILMPGTGYQGGVPVVKVKDIRDGQIALEDLLLTTPSIDREYRRSRLKPGDLLFTIRGTVGRMAVVPAQLDQANITQDTARIGLVRGNPHVVREYMNMPKPRAFMETHTIGVAVRGINLRDLRRVTIAEPPRMESDEIALRLKSASARLEAETEGAAKVCMLKHGLMEDLLTGRVRVTKLLENAAP